VIRYGNGVWSDHRRGMFHGATKRQGAITTGAGRPRRSATRRRAASQAIHNALRQYHDTHKPLAPRERYSAEPWTMAPLEVRIDGPCVLYMHRIVRGKRQLLGGLGAPIPHCLPQHQKERSKGRYHQTKRAPTHCGGMLDAPACSPVPHLFD